MEGDCIRFFSYEGWGRRVLIAMFGAGSREGLVSVGMVLRRRRWRDRYPKRIVFSQKGG